MPSRPVVPSLIATAAAALLVAAGCTTTSPYNPGPSRTTAQRRAEFPIDHDAYGQIGYRLDWVGYPYVTGSLPILFFQPYDDIVVTVEEGSTVSILEANTGSTRCADQLANPLTRFTGFVRDGDRIYCASEGEVFTIDTRTCNLVARARNARNVATEPLLFNNLLIFGSGVGEILAHLATGSVGGVKTWGFLSPGGAVDRNPVLIGGAVGAVSQTGHIIFLDAQTGSLLGQNRIYGGASTHPVANEHLMFVASLDQSLYAFSPVNAQLIWRYRTAAPLRVQPTAHGDRVYCAIPDQGLTAFEANTGKVLWTTKGFQGTVVAINKNRLVAWDGSTAVLIDPDRGDILERASLPGVRMLRPDQFDSGNLYVVSNSGVVAKFQPK